MGYMVLKTCPSCQNGKLKFSSFEFDKYICKSCNTVYKGDELGMKTDAQMKKFFAKCDKEHLKKRIVLEREKLRLLDEKIRKMEEQIKIYDKMARGLQ